MRNQLFYVQDSRTYVGNDMLWWRKGNRGYTTNLEEAEIYTKEEIQKKFLGNSVRESDIIWPFEQINSIARRTVDMQYTNSEWIVKELL